MNSHQNHIFLLYPPHKTNETSSTPMSKLLSNIELPLNTSSLSSSIPSVHHYLIQAPHYFIIYCKSTLDTIKYLKLDPTRLILLPPQGGILIIWKAHCQSGHYLCRLLSFSRRGTHSLERSIQGNWYKTKFKCTINVPIKVLWDCWLLDTCLGQSMCFEI